MFTWILTSVLLVLNLCLWIGNICNGLLLGNASIARGLTCCKNTRKTWGFKKIMVYKIPPGGGGKPYLASGLLGFLSHNILGHSSRRIQNLKTLAFIDAEKSVKEIFIGKKNGQIKGMLSRRRLIRSYTIQQITRNICTKFQNPRFSSSWEIFDEKKKFTHNSPPLSPPPPLPHIHTYKHC